MLTQTFVTELHSNINKLQKLAKFKDNISNFSFQYPNQHKRKIKTHKAQYTEHFEYEDVTI
jgi:hypothetical protein